MSSDINYLVEKATSPLLLDSDWDTTLHIVDLIRQGDISPKAASNALLTRLEDTNPNVVLLGLQVLESIVKNCGQIIHEYVATRDFMEGLYRLLQNSTNDEVQKRALMMLAAWVYAFRNEPKYRAVQDTVNILKAEGYHVPTVIESDAMFTADRAPEWADGGRCHRCRTQFTMLRRKHHCRACGQVFCSECSGKSSTIPKFGIERDVRVCDSCHEDINNPQPTNSKPKIESSLPLTSTIDANAAKKNTNSKTADEIREEEEFQLALALSKSEAEDKEKEKLRATSTLLGGGRPRDASPTPPITTKKDYGNEKEETDPELAKYLNRSYWEEQKQKQQQMINPESNSLRSFSPNLPSAPHKVPSPSKITEVYQNGETEEVDEFVSTLRSQLEIFVNRMKSNQSRGRPIANDTAVQSLFMNITAMHAQLLKYIQQQDGRRVHCEQLQDKISQIRDARAALEALREEHRDKVRREREEQERIRQIQMMQKLEIMRKKKQEYLEYQRQLALHRMAESERQILSVQQASVGPSPNAPPGAPTGYPIPYQSFPAQPQMPGYMYSGQGGEGMNIPPPNIMPPFQGHSPAQSHGPLTQPGPPGNNHGTYGGPVAPSVPSTAGSGAPPQCHPEYSAFNMQNLTQNLPSVPGYGSIPPSSGTINSPPNNVDAPPGVAQTISAQPQILPPQQPLPMQQPPPPKPEEQAELISFD